MRIGYSERREGVGWATQAGSRCQIVRVQARQASSIGTAREVAPSVRYRRLADMAKGRRRKAGWRRRHEGVAVVAIVAGTTQSRGLQNFILLERQRLHRLLLVLEGASGGTGGAGRRTDAERILAVRKANATMLDKTIQGIAIQVVQCPRCTGDVVELMRELVTVKRNEQRYSPRQSTWGRWPSYGSTSSCSLAAH